LAQIDIVSKKEILRGVCLLARELDEEDARLHLPALGAELNLPPYWQSKHLEGVSQLGRC